MTLSMFLNLLDWWKKLKSMERNMASDGWESKDFKGKLRKSRKVTKKRKNYNSNFNIELKSRN